MTGFTAVFASIFTGTLHGKWPDLGLWIALLAMADRHGVVDVTPQYISTMTGLPVADVAACIQGFMAPDPHSRTPDHDGRRLTLIDPARPWGWRVVNHAKYRERQRKRAWDEDRTASGADAERKRRGRKSRRVPTSLDESPHVPTVPALTSTSTSTSSKRMPSASLAASPPTDEQFHRFKALYPPRAGDQDWAEARRSIRARLREGHAVADILAGVQRYRTYCDAEDVTGTKFVKKAVTFFGPKCSFLEPWDVSPSKARRQQDRNVAAALRWANEGAQS